MSLITGSRRSTLSAQFAAFAVDTTFDGLPDDVKERTLKVVLDTLAVAKAGSDDPFCARYIDSIVASAGKGRSSVVRGGHRVGAETAAFVNALTTTVMQIDEGHRESRGHPGIHIVPAALAVAEEVNATGAALLESVLIGYEISVRISRSLAQFPRETHSHGTWGAFGAAVAAAKLWDADVGGLEAVIDAVAAFPLLPARSPVTEGGTIHHLNAAIAAQSGVALARATIAGAEVPVGMLEGYYQPTLGGAIPKPVEFSTYEILGNYFKVYPSCAHMHTAIEALERIITDTAIHAGDIDRIDVYAFNEAANLDVFVPANNLAARFSIPHVLARLVVRGGLGLDIWTREDVAAADISAIAERVHLHADAELAAGYPAGRPVRVVVTRRDGAKFEASEDTARGESNRPEPETAWREKLKGLLGVDVADALLEFQAEDPRRWKATSLGQALSV